MIFLSTVDNLMLLRYKVTYSNLSQILDSLNIPNIQSCNIRFDNIKFALCHCFYSPHYNLMHIFAALNFCFWPHLAPAAFSPLIQSHCRYQGYFYLPSSSSLYAFQPGRLFFKIQWWHSLCCIHTFNFLDKNTGVNYHFLSTGSYLVCPLFYDPPIMGDSPGSVHSQSIVQQHWNTQVPLPQQSNEP